LPVLTSDPFAPVEVNSLVRRSRTPRGVTTADPRPRSMALLRTSITAGPGMATRIVASAAKARTVWALHAGDDVPHYTRNPCVVS